MAFIILGLIGQILWFFFWPLLWLSCGISLIALAHFRGEKLTRRQVKGILAFGPFIYLCWLLFKILDYLGIPLWPIVGRIKNLLDFKDLLKDKVRDKANDCKKTALSYKDKVASYKNQLVEYLKKKSKKQENSEEKNDKEDTE